MFITDKYHDSRPDAGYQTRYQGRISGKVPGHIRQGVRARHHIAVDGTFYTGIMRVDAYREKREIYD